MSTEDLEALLAKLGSGDVEAAEQVFRAYEPYLRKVVRRQLPGRLRAKFDSIDVVQSVWADLVHGFREAGWRFTDVPHLQAFLVKITRNRFIDRVRQHHAALEREQPLQAGADGESPLAPDPRPSEVVAADELWQQMLLLCPPDHRSILHLKRQGFSVPEIAEHTGLHEDSIRRILRTLASRLATHYGAPVPGARP